MEIPDENAISLAVETKREKLVQSACALIEKFERIEQEFVSFKTEFAAIESELASIDGGDTRRDLLARLLSTCGHSCAHHVVVMNPALWSTLPKELLHLVFARLPLPQIIRLRCLSKEWDQNLTSELGCDFRGACAEANPKMFAMITEGFFQGRISIRLYDVNSNRWFSFIELPPEELHVDTLCAGDGGLVCIVSVAEHKKRLTLFILVLNPLTREWRQLPSHALTSVKPSMVQLVMDRETKCYKVLVVGEKKPGCGGGVAATIFSSETGEWSSPKAYPHLIFGYEYDWLGEDDECECDDPSLIETRLGPCAYDSAEGQLLELDDHSNPRRGASARGHALVKDHLFVLHKETVYGGVLGEEVLGKRYCISEFQGQKGEPNWVKLRVHRCSSDFDRPSASSRYRGSLYACKGFLLVQFSNGINSVFQHELAWLYDLSTCEWRAIPAFPSASYSPEDAMFELQWDAVP